MPQQNLHLPQGSEAFYLDEAYVHRRLVRAFEDRCELWAYLPVQTPVYDFHELYRGLLDRSRESTTYRLVDRAGDLLVLRSDITLFLARQMGLVLEHTDLPVRVYYGDTILRHEDPHDISKNEFFQVGAELIGATGLAADAEVMLLLFDALDHWGASDVVLHIGHRALLREYNESGELAPAVSARNWDFVRETLARHGVPDDQIDSLLSLYGFIGSAEELSRFTESLPGLGTDERNTISHLLSLAEEFEALGYGERVRIDLSEVGSQTYHSGVVFQAYAPDTAAAVASGGRYDGLLARFGFDAPSVGFSVMLRRLQSRRSGGVEHATPQIFRPSATSFRERCVEAQSLRAQGKAVEL
ncbi:MAG: ATP phosphoribosyltransferase regulatory subunit [Spirochaetota bacterium]